MPLVISVFAESWGTAGTTSCRIGSYSVSDSRPITCIVRERQLRLYGHVACYQEVDPAHRVVSVRDNPVWKRPRGRPQLPWLEQVDESCQELVKPGFAKVRLTKIRFNEFDFFAPYPGVTKGNPYLTKKKMARADPRFAPHLSLLPLVTFFAL